MFYRYKYMFIFYLSQYFEKKSYKKEMIMGYKSKIRVPDRKLDAETI